MDSEALGFRLGPRLNAAGRLDDAGKGVRLMMTDDPDEADRLADELDALNTERRAASGGSSKRRRRRPPDMTSSVNAHSSCADGIWHVGVIGLAAGRLCQQYYCPHLRAQRA